MDHASKGGTYIVATGHKYINIYTINVTRDACPDGKEYLSGPPGEKGSSLIEGRLLLVIPFTMQSIMTSNINPENNPSLDMFLVCYTYIINFILDLPIKRFTSN